MDFKYFLFTASFSFLLLCVFYIVPLALLMDLDIRKLILEAGSVGGHVTRGKEDYLGNICNISCKEL